jgi:hypothetical protein
MAREILIIASHSLINMSVNKPDIFSQISITEYTITKQQKLANIVE